MIQVKYPLPKKDELLKSVFMNSVGTICKRTSERLVSHSRDQEKERITGITLGFMAYQPLLVI